jgi:hypothetical protein
MLWSCQASPQDLVAGDVTEEIGDAEPALSVASGKRKALDFTGLQRARRNQLTSRRGAIKVQRQ